MAEQQQPASAGFDPILRALAETHGAVADMAKIMVAQEKELAALRKQVYEYQTGKRVTLLIDGHPVQTQRNDSWLNAIPSVTVEPVSADPFARSQPGLSSSGQMRALNGREQPTAGVFPDTGSIRALPKPGQS